MWNRIDRWRAEWVDEYAIQNTLRYEKQQREFWKWVRETENKDTLEKARNKLKETIWKIRNLAFDWFWIHKSISGGKKESMFIYYDEWENEINYLLSHN